MKLLYITKHRRKTDKYIKLKIDIKYCTNVFVGYLLAHIRILIFEEIALINIIYY